MPKFDWEGPLAKLQDRLSEVDLLSRPRLRANRRSRSGAEYVATEFLVKEYRAIKLRMDGDKTHARPHIHIDYGNDHHVASYAVDTGERLAGELDTKYDKKYDKAVKAWIETHRSELLATWNEVQSGGVPNDNIIAALKGSAMG